MKMKQPMSIHKSNSLPRTGPSSPRSTSNTSNRSNSPSGSPYAWRKINRQNSAGSNVSSYQNIIDFGTELPEIGTELPEIWTELSEIGTELPEIVTELPEQTV